MKASVLHGVGDLRYETVPDPEPAPGEAVVRVGACGVCGSDIPRIFSKGTYSFPTIPGHELAGTVARVGGGVDEALVGRRVTVFPLIPCRRCAMCEAGEYALCADYSYLGSRCDGGFAELVRAPAWNLLPVPDGVSIEEAAMTEPAAVALHALKRGGMSSGECVLIVGAGTIGVVVALWARILGASKVLLVDIDQRKLDFARSLGFEHVADAGGENITEWGNRLTGSGVDLSVEAAGHAAALDQCLRTTRPMGRVVLLGNPAGDMAVAQHAYWAILRKQLTLIGTWNSAYQPTPPSEWSMVLEHMASGQLNLKPLITHRVGLHGLSEILAQMRDRAVFANKVMYVGPAEPQ
ncbi:MAG: galactitol-1-phosphate 5-dehydrogenase [Candidatus Hydrogenedentota bacterium]